MRVIGIMSKVVYKNVPVNFGIALDRSSLRSQDTLLIWESGRKDHYMTLYHISDAAAANLGYFRMLSSIPKITTISAQWTT
jgi:hypothetical protein